MPHLGKIEYRDKIGITVADLPGIEPENVPFYFNTSSRAGRFLQHCARCKSLLYLIDGSKDIPLNSVEQFRIIREHLESYDFEIEREQREIQLSKTEFPDRFQFSEVDESITSVSLTQVPFIGKFMVTSFVRLTVLTFSVKISLDNFLIKFKILCDIFALRI